MQFLGGVSKAARTAVTRLATAKKLACVAAPALVSVAAWLAAYHPALQAQAPPQRGVTVLPPSQAATTNGSFHALVIGINEYQRPLANLKTAVDDAQAVARILSERYGFQTQLLLNAKATRANILNALSQYRRTLRANDNLLIYYAGHGHSDPEADKAYWLPADAASETSSNWIIADELTTDVRVLPARHVLIISDSCYSGGLTRDANLTARPSDQKVFVNKMLAGRSRTLMASGGDEPVADGGAGLHSVFADAVLRALERATGDAFTAGELFHNFVQQSVAGRSRQVPQYSFIRNSDHDDGDFVFIRKGAAVAVPALPASPEVPPASASGLAKRAGEKWEELKQAPPKLTSMVVHGKAIVGADGSAQVYRSEDSGAHWTAHPMPDPKATIVTLASCGSLLLAGATNEGKPNDVPLFVSQDDGKGWKATGLEGNRVTAAGCFGKMVVAGMWPRTQKERGAQFRAVNLKGDVVGDVVYPTLVVSSDGGGTWELLRRKFNLLSAMVTDQGIEVFGRDLTVASITPQYKMDYCYKKQDWTCVRIRSKYSGAWPTTLQRVGQALFVGTRVGSIMVSRNEGTAWKETLLPLEGETQTGSDAPRIAGFPNSIDVMTTAKDHVVAGTSEKGVFLSDTAGETWAKVGDRELSRLRCLQYDGEFLYAGTLEGVYRIRLTKF